MMELLKFLLKSLWEWLNAKEIHYDPYKPKGKL